ncbi:MAG TPA: CehA/McbA family metallohydrolase [bacterium]|nr:CehA/McbA family metallohydrolase [bacterium]HQL62881.1 CehA/McbA family metallohydrolase [bacterium]
MQSRVLLHCSDTLTLAEDKSIRIFHFEVPPETQALALDLQYSPIHADDPESVRWVIQHSLDVYFCGNVPDEVYIRKSPEEKKEIFDWVFKNTRNYLFFAVFDPGGNFRGYWDRNHKEDPKRVVLFAGSRERGFIGGEISAGQWRLELEIHKIVTESCEFSLNVESVPVPETAPTPKRDYIPKEKTGGSGWFRGELHLHTNHSDGLRSLAEMAESARRTGLDFIALTDHNGTAGLVEISDDLPLTVIPGLEFTTFQGHATALGVWDYIPWTEEGIPRDPSELAEDVKRQGGLFCVAHANILGDPICPGCRWVDDRLQAASVDLLEVWHGEYEREAIGNIKNLLLWQALLREGYRVVAVAGGDLHDLFENQFKPDTAFTVVYAESDAREHLLEGLRRGHVYISSGPTVDLYIQGNEPPAHIGDEVELLEGSTYTLRLTAQNVGAGGYVRLFRGDNVLIEMPLSSTRDSRLAFRFLAEKEETYFRAEIYRYARPRDQLLALTNPVYVGTRPHVVFRIVDGSENPVEQDIEE